MHAYVCVCVGVGGMCWVISKYLIYAGHTEREKEREWETVTDENR